MRTKNPKGDRWPKAGFAWAAVFALTSGATLHLAAAAPGPTTSAQSEWALAIHGGAGVIPKTLPQDLQQQYFDALRRALALGRDLLASGASSLDVVEQVVRNLEDSPLFNAGKGAVFTHDGTHELDAAIMNGQNLACGAISGVKTVKNPITLARHVMEHSRHVFLVGPGAEAFATAMEVERVEPSYFFTPHRYDQWLDALAKEAASAKAAPSPPAPATPKSDQPSSSQPSRGQHSTVGAVAFDRHGHLAAATSTGGMTNKRFGRVGDVPVIGAGTYANDATAAISCTGFGEQFIRHTVARDITALMEYRGLSLDAAAALVIHHKLQPGDGGMIGVDRRGNLALVWNSEGMFRGAADASGRFEVGIWEATDGQ